jgi:hemimethylated DNA binding protein
MPDARQIPALLSLLDDDDPATQQAISRALLDFGDSLQIELARLQTAPSDSQRAGVQRSMAPWSRRKLEENWPRWQHAAGEDGRLEAGLSLLSDYLSGFEIPEGLPTLLDRLANAFSVHSHSSDPMALADYLFSHLQFKGEDQNFHHPRNSDLCRVIKNRRGNPISLASLFMLVGRRLDMAIGGCNFPGHFLARVGRGGSVKLVDCFNGGKIVDHKVIAAMSEQTPWGVQSALQTPAGSRTMLTRVLTNLLRAFQEVNSPLDAQLMTRLLGNLEPHDPELPTSPMQAGPPSGLPASPKFHTGQLVRHQRYGYRGVVVDFDMACKADEAWYRQNRSQPDKGQPWYHILVDRTDQVTYAAESNLLADDSRREIFHPLVARLFDRFENGRYIRNHQPWQGL